MPPSLISLSAPRLPPLPDSLSLSAWGNDDALGDGARGATAAHWAMARAEQRRRTGRRRAGDDGMQVDGMGLGFRIRQASGAEDVDPR